MHTDLWVSAVPLHYFNFLFYLIFLLLFSLICFPRKIREGRVLALSAGTFDWASVNLRRDLSISLRLIIYFTKLAYLHGKYRKILRSEEG